MAWGFRNGKAYYFRSKRVGGEVRTECFGGPLAELEARADEEAREARRREAERFDAEDEIDREIDGIIDKIETFTVEQLQARGYHKHKREWRRRRAKG